MKFPLTILIFLIILSGCLEISPSPSSTTQTFTIQPLTTAKDKNITFLVYINGTEVTPFNSNISFLVTPIGGETVDDKFTLYFSADDFDTQLFKFNGAYQIRWYADGHLFYERGSVTLSPVDHSAISVDFDFNIYELSQITNSSLTLNFRNKDDSWSESYTVRIVVVEVI